MTRDEALAVLMRHAKDEIYHRWEGECPENHDIYRLSRDPDCEICRALVALEPDKPILLWSLHTDGPTQIVPADWMPANPDPGASS